MAQWLRGLAVLPDDLGLLHSAHMVAKAPGPIDPMPSSERHKVHRHTYGQKHQYT